MDEDCSRIYSCKIDPNVESIEELMIRAFRADRDAIAADRDAIAADRNRLLNSTCWRMTEPIRFVLDTLKARSYGKLIRGTIKQFVPYGLMAWWLNWRYGERIDMPLLYFHGVGKRLRRVVKFLLPYGLVMLVRTPVQYSVDRSLHELLSMSKAEKRLYGLWKNVRDGFSPFDDDLILPPLDGSVTVAPTEEVVDVIVPIYNGLQHLKRLLPALFRNTSQPHRFIFVNDCSTDAGVKEFVLNMIQGRSDSKYLENEQNLGFPGTVNHGAEFVTSKYFVLLNTDVIVPENWLERLIAPMVKDETICTTTPFTNSGVFYSFPNFGENHALSPDDDYLSCDRYFRRRGVRLDPDLEFVNGTGYCMGIRKSCWDRLGGLDAETFGKGYGEETDLCMRYLDAGYKNILVPNLFVYHNHGGSFASAEKKYLMDAHAEIIRSRWPGFIELLPMFVKCDPWARFRLAVLREQYGRTTDCLIIDLNRSAGGACKFRYQQEQSLYASGLKVVSVLYTDENPTRWTLAFVNNDGRAEFRLRDWYQVYEWIVFLSPKEVFVNNVAFCQDYHSVITWLAATPRCQFRLKYCFHDFLSCCPSYFLLGRNNRFCNYENCRDCLSLNQNRLFPVTDIDNWRSYWRKFLERCDEYRFFSENTYRIVSQIYQLPRECVVVRGHDPLLKVTTEYSFPVGEGALNIAVLGAWSQAKGCKQVLEFACLLKKSRPTASIHFYGLKWDHADDAFVEENLPNFFWEGKYEIATLPDRLTRDRIAVVFFPSVSPETYSFVVHECMEMGVALVGFDIGASGDAIKDYKYGCVVADFDTTQILPAIDEVVRRRSSCSN